MLSSCLEMLSILKSPETISLPKRETETRKMEMKALIKSRIQSASSSLLTFWFPEDSGNPAGRCGPDQSLSWSQFLPDRLKGIYLISAAAEALAFTSRQTESSLRWGRLPAAVCLGGRIRAAPEGGLRTFLLLYRSWIQKYSNHVKNIVFLKTESAGASCFSRSFTSLKKQNRRFIPDRRLRSRPGFVSDPTDRLI